MSSDIVVTDSLQGVGFDRIVNLGKEQFSRTISSNTKFIMNLTFVMNSHYKHMDGIDKY